MELVVPGWYMSVLNHFSYDMEGQEASPLPLLWLYWKAWSSMPAWNTILLTWAAKVKMKQILPFTQEWKCLIATGVFQLPSIIIWKKWSHQPFTFYGFRKRLEQWYKIGALCIWHWLSSPKQDVSNKYGISHCSLWCISFVIFVAFLKDLNDTVNLDLHAAVMGWQSPKSAEIGHHTILTVPGYG